MYDSRGNASRVGVEERVYNGANRHVGTRNGVTPVALLVVGDAVAPGSKDTWKRQRLLDAGWSVVVADDNAVTAADATGKALVVVSESAAQTLIGAMFNAVAVPVVMEEVWLYDEMGMTAAGLTNQGRTELTPPQTQLAVTAAGGGHDLGGGLAAGVHTVTTTANGLGWGKPAPTAVVAATLPGDASAATIFGYEAGAAMKVGVAPARRVGWWHYTGNGTQLNGTAGVLFDAAVAWAAGTTPNIGYTRDATDRIVERRVNTRVEARYSYTGTGDTSDLTLDGSNNLVEATLALPGGALYTWRAAAEVWSWPNLNGHVTAVTDATGTKVGPTRSYDPYGQPLTASGVPIDNSAGEMDYGWHGQQQRPLEHQSGAIPTIEMGARQYDPALGRFLEVDPIEGGTANDYVYVDDTINGTDLDGTRGNYCTSSSSNARCVQARRSAADRRARQSALPCHVRNRSPSPNCRRGQLSPNGLRVTAAVLGVAGALTTGGTSLALTAAALGTGVSAEAVDRGPCRSQRITIAAAGGWFGGGVGSAFAAGGSRVGSAATSAGLASTSFVPVRC